MIPGLFIVTGVILLCLKEWQVGAVFAVIGIIAWLIGKWRKKKRQGKNS